MPPVPYQWLTLPTAIAQIQDRLNDQGVFWSVAEVQAYLIEGLRILNALTESFRVEWQFSTSGSKWINAGNPEGVGIPPFSPRQRTITDDQIASQIEYMLLEPAVGIGAWTGTNQFSVQKIQEAMQVKANEIIQASGCNTVNLPPIAGAPTQRRTYLTDTTLELRRVRWMATNPDGSVSPYYLKRSDTQAFHYFNSDYLQDVGIPKQWSLASEPPLSFDVDVFPNTEGNYDVLVLQAQTPLSTTPTVLNLPPDWTWLLVYGVMADLLSEEPESTDRQRATYCLKRYEDGLDMMRKSNWFVQALINGSVADTPSLEKKDRWSIGWQEDAGGIPCVVTDGIDQFNVAPPTASTVTLSLIQNAPFLDPTNTWVQVTRDDWDQVLNYTQHTASFKMGGAEFVSTLPLLDEFLKYCVRKNKRQATYGLYVDVLDTAGQKQDIEQPR